MPLWTREPQQQGFIYNYKVVSFLINNKVNYFIALVPVEYLIALDIFIYKLNNLNKLKVDYFFL